MPAPKSRELLFRLLQDETPSPEEVSGLVRAFEATKELEGQWFDLKAGALLQNKQGDDLRAAACGFANAEGGFLLIGYNEKAKAFDHVAPVGGQQPEQWVTNALGSLAHVIPPPRFETVEVEGGPVLLVTIERARPLVYVIEKGEPVYYLRFGHQTLPMAPSHVGDLLLGRRAQPDLRVTQVRVSDAELVNERGSRASTLIAALRVDYENEALILAEMVRCGLVGWSLGERHGLPQQLRRSIDLVATPPDDLVSGGYPWGAWGIRHIRSMPADSVEPFAPGQAIIERWALPLFWRVGLPPLRPGQVPPPGAAAQAEGGVEVKVALYLIAKNTEPSWWQLTLRYDEGGQRQLTERHDRHLRFEPCPYSRPVVSLRFLPEGEAVEFPAPKGGP